MTAAHRFVLRGGTIHDPAHGCDGVQERLARLGVVAAEERGLDDADARQRQGIVYVHFCDEWIANFLHSTHRRMEYIKPSGFQSARAQVPQLVAPVFCH
jgi:hypothetical protein